MKLPLRHICSKIRIRLIHIRDNGMYSGQATCQMTKDHCVLLILACIWQIGIKISIKISIKLSTKISTKLTFSVKKKNLVKHLS